ncbi:hypothetical protein SKAU_G00304610 [Synaphobranchus kaupii]|uniref:Uncharacterized protein n=1 Tax=Synaphobranchus kaupii TaxID=118154 RepID=A0A9Q1EWE9_SYNKA|nr:hypothetical protein SKAU_G00304610 [Synaphobranchus kaupii]
MLLWRLDSAGAEWLLSAGVPALSTVGAEPRFLLVQIGQGSNPQGSKVTASPVRATCRSLLHVGGGNRNVWGRFRGTGNADDGRHSVTSRRLAGEPSEADVFPEPRTLSGSGEMG